MHSGWSQHVSGYTVGVGGKVVCCREAGFWAMAGEALCCASCLGKHWDVWEVCRVEVVVAWSRRAVMAVVTGREVVEMLCFRKMGNVI